MKRYQSLDGLRGVAALIVLLDHVMLTGRLFADGFSGSRGIGSGRALLTVTPLHLFWAGGEAVVVFFILSGFVLALRRPVWRAYYPQRLIRLYLPVAAALALALPQGWLLRRATASSSDGFWMQIHAGTGWAGKALHDVFLVDGSSKLVSPLWSLQWEVWFSLLLPGYLLLLRVRNRWDGLAVGALLVVLAGIGSQTGSAWLEYLPIFGLGVLIAGHRSELRGSHSAVAIGTLMLVAPWSIRRLWPLMPDLAFVDALLVAVGACLVVIGLLDGAPWLCGPRIQWLGRRSFALYLVHEPIVVSVANLLGGHPPVLLEAVIAIPLSVLAAELFGLLIDEPAQRLSRWAGGRARRREPGSAPSPRSAPAPSPAVSSHSGHP